MNNYRVERNEEENGYVIQCYDEFKEHIHTIPFMFQDKSYAEEFAVILNKETEEAYRNGQISNI